MLILLPTFLLLRRRRASERLAPGSLGIPVIGQTLSFLRAMRTNQAEKWLEEKISKYGPIWKFSLFGKPTVFISGEAANKFIFTNNDGKILSNAKPKCMTELLGNRNLLEMSGKDHKRLRDALMMFLKPDSLKLYVGKMDRELREHLDMHWQGKEKVTVMPLMKTLTLTFFALKYLGWNEDSAEINYGTIVRHW